MKKLRTALTVARSMAHFSLTEKVTIQVISVLSMVSTLTTFLTFLIVFSSNQSWQDVRDYVLHWMIDNNINANATRYVIEVLSWVSDHSTLINSLFILSTLVHFIFSCLLYIGARPNRPRLRLPWLVSHMLIIILTTIVFICWTFVTFFIDLLVTIVFPVLSGLVLGVSILLWRLVHSIHCSYSLTLTDNIEATVGHIKGAGWIGDHHKSKSYS